jgi:predicted Fe-Mo cluster-binding NifX family protein
MRIAVAAEGRDPEDRVSETFGRSPWFVILDTESEVRDAFRNAAGDLPGGAGPAAASTLAERRVEMVLAGRVGPKAEHALATAGIRFVRAGGTVREALEAAVRGESAE